MEKYSASLAGGYKERLGKTIYKNASTHSLISQSIKTKESQRVSVSFFAKYFENEQDAS